MLLARAILPTFLIFRCVRSYDDDEDLSGTTNQCSQEETFSLADVDGIITFSGKATCEKYQKIYQFNPDPNAKKGRMLSVPKYSGRSYLNFDITEFTVHPNGTIDRRIVRQGDSIMGNKMWFAPTTGILVNFTRNGGYDYDYYFSFTGTIAETALHHHCPYPFIDLQPYQPLVLDDAFVMYKCDVLVTAPEDYEIRIDHITDTAATHNTQISIWEGSRVIESFTDFPLEETMTGSDEVTICVNRATDHSHQIEIQLSAVKLNCTCGPTEHVFNASLIPGVFATPDYPKKHCKLISCQKSFILPVELRTKYKMQLDYFRIEQGVIEIEDGPNGILTRNDRLNDYHALSFESPLVTIKYSPTDRWGDVFSLSMGLVERCVCPPQPNIETNFYVEIPTHCKAMDCQYLLPMIDDNTVLYNFERDDTNDYVGWRERSRLHNTNYFYSGVRKGIWTFDARERVLIRFHRELPTKRPTIFNFTYTTSGVHISHEERCGCFNKTILLEANQEMEFTSPDFPAHYCDNLVCVTTYVAPAHHHLEVKLGEISLEPENDRVAFFEGTNITEKHMELITGESIISDPITSASTVMTTVFISNAAVAFDGFNGTITAVMDKSWAHHVSSWWWLIAVVLLISIVGGVLFVWRRGGLRRRGSINLMDM